ncbi:hypothetical protein MKW98_006708 [Papaver atlanticum]|uniref:Uncharacterized protein n=1 Tax=Papaver atlanticum TaxID=357466 RepID=A0AAD4T0N4_9MAGN|nr:hypothetical protein MKW98_006708 [Papaver atlanticum]
MEDLKDGFVVDGDVHDFNTFQSQLSSNLLSLSTTTLILRVVNWELQGSNGDWFVKSAMKSKLGFLKMERNFKINFFCGVSNGSTTAEEWLFVGLNKGHIVTTKELAPRPYARKGA